MMRLTSCMAYLTTPWIFSADRAPAAAPMAGLSSPAVPGSITSVTIGIMPVIAGPPLAAAAARTPMLLVIEDASQGFGQRLGEGAVPTVPARIHAGFI